MNKIQKIILITLFVSIIHAIEEYFTNFHNIDSSVLVFSKLFHINTLSGWIIIQFALYLFYIISLLFLLKKKVSALFVLFFSVILIIELSHFYYAIILGHYYPGLITAIAFPIIGSLFYREYLKNYAS